MAWLEAHQSLSGHPKTRKAARMLGISKAELIGHLFLLWWWAIDYAPDGDVSRFEDEDLAIAAEWDGDAQAFVNALIECRYGEGAGFLERSNGRLLIHDWDDYAGKLIQRRTADAARKAAERKGQKGGHPGDVQGTDAVPSINSAPVQRTSSGHPADDRTDGVRREHTQQNRTQDHLQDTTNTTNLAPDADAPDAFSSPSSGELVVLGPHGKPLDLIWEALVGIFGEPELKQERSILNGVCQQFREAAAKKGVSDERIAAMIDQAHGNWGNAMAGMPETPTSFAKYFTVCLKGPQRNGRDAGTVREVRQRLAHTASVVEQPSLADLRRRREEPA